MDYNCTFSNGTYFNSAEPCNDNKIRIDDVLQMIIFIFLMFGLLCFVVFPTYSCCSQCYRYRTIQREVRIVEIHHNYSDYIISIEKPSEKEEIICIICLDDFNNKEEVGKLENCEHIFHKKCIKRWLEENPICPICRTKM